METPGRARLWAVAALIGALIGLMALGTARAQQPQPPAAPRPPEHPAIEPAALEIIRATSERLAGAQSMSFTAVATYKSPARERSAALLHDAFQCAGRRGRTSSA